VHISENQCSSDNDCAISSYCHSSQHAPSRCAPCRRRKKRCSRDTMCCPGNRCSNSICVAFPENLKTQHISDLKEQKKLSKDKGWKKSGKVQTKVSLK
ncbi:dickkopf-related protein 2, partial [Clarias magur]